MKELSIEEKAKAYDNALAHAKLLLKTIGNATLGNLVLKNEFEVMFPILKEDEDERIRKALIQLVNQCSEEFLLQENARQMLAWLEKKGEKELDNKVEPKFKVGDTIRHKGQGCTCKITAINTTEYEVSGCNGNHLPFDFQDAWELVEQESSWSEEDKEMIDDIIRCLPKMANGNIAILPNRAEEYADRLASLRPCWKPNEEQMKALEEVCDLYCDVYNFTPPKALIDLFTDLKNLMN